MSNTQDGATLAETEQVTVTETPVDSANTEQGAEQAQSTEANAEQAQSEQAKPAGPTPEELEQLARGFIALIGEPTKDSDGVITWKPGVGVMGGDGDGAVDTSTGAIPDGKLNELKAEFSNLPAGPARKAVRDWVEGWMEAAMDSLDPVTARSLHMIKRQALTGGASTQANTGAAKQPVNPTQAFVDAVVALYLAPYAVQVPEGVDANWGAQVNDIVSPEDGNTKLVDGTREYAAWADAVAALPADATDEQKAALPEPNVPEVAKAAYRIARGRAGNTARRRASGGSSSGSGTATRRTSGDGVRRSVGNHIAEAFAAHPVGTFLKVSEIVNFKSQEYGDQPISAGAVSARLFPDKNATQDGTKCTVPGVNGAVQNGHRGGIKVS